MITPTLQNPTPQGPPPMVLKNPLSNQGMVSNQLLAPQNPTTTYAAQPIDPIVHHLITLSFNFNLNTQRNQYGYTTESINPSAASRSTTLDMYLHLPRPPMDVTAKVSWFSLRHITNNATAIYALNYTIVNGLA